MQNIYNWVPIASAIVSVFGALVTIILLFYKAPSEKKNIEAQSKNLEAQSESSLADAAESVISGAKISNELLLQRIEELDKKNNQMEEELKKMRKDFDAVKAELIEWKDYAFRLAHQVQSLGHEPIPFKPMQSAKLP